MSNMKVVIEGDFGVWPQKMRAGVSKVVRATAFSIEADEKKAILSPKGGRTYVRGNTKHQASAPGEAPASDTGALVNSIQTKMVGDLSAEVAVNVEYGAGLEYGTTKVLARPFVAPAIEKNRKQFNDDLSKLGRVS